MWCFGLLRSVVVLVVHLGLKQMLHLTAKWERQIAKTAKLDVIIQENLRGWDNE
jgi:hypothetical protein